MLRSPVLLAASAVCCALIAGCGGDKTPGPVPIVVASATPAPSPAPNGAPSADDMAKAAAALDRFHALAAAADEAGYFAMFDEGGVFLGTDATERWTVPQFRAYAHPRFASGKAWSFRSIHRDVTVRGDVAWFDEDLDTPNLGLARGSGVLVRNAQGEWKIAQYNLSVPIPNERFAAVKRVIEGSGGGAAPAAPAATPVPVPVPVPVPRPTQPTPTPPPPAVGPNPPVCAMARSARARNSPATAALEAQCRAQGGTP